MCNTASCSPDLDGTILSPSRNQISVRMMRQAYRALALDCIKIIVQPASSHSKAVDEAILSQAIEPLPPWGQAGPNKITAYTLARCHGLHNLRPSTTSEVGILAGYAASTTATSRYLSQKSDMNG